MEIKVHGSPMMHDFALTEQYVVVFDLPVTFDVGMATGDVPRPVRPLVRATLNRIIGRNPLPEPLSPGWPAAAARRPTLPYSWNPDYPARIGLLPRDGGTDDVRWFEIDPCFVFHSLNAYDEGDTVVIDVVRHDRMFATDFTGPNEGPATLTRFVVDLAAGKVREERFDERCAGVPAPRRAADRAPAPLRLRGRVRRRRRSATRCVKHDLVAGSSQVRRLGEGREASEFCFVPRAAGSREDDGVLMGYVHDRARGLQRPGPARRPDPRGRRRGPPAGPGAGRLPRQLGADRLRARPICGGATPRLYYRA